MISRGYHIKIINSNLILLLINTCDMRLLNSKDYKLGENPNS